MIYKIKKVDIDNVSFDPHSSNRLGNILITCGKVDIYAEYASWFDSARQLDNPIIDGCSVELHGVTIVITGTLVTKDDEDLYDELVRMVKVAVRAAWREDGFNCFHPSESNVIPDGVVKEL